MSKSLQGLELTIASDLLTLEILDYALAAAHNALVTAFPDLDELDDPYRGLAPPHQVLLVALLRPRIGEMRQLLAWYRNACRVHLPPAFHDDPF